MKNYKVTVGLLVVAIAALLALVVIAVLIKRSSSPLVGRWESPEGFVIILRHDNSYEGGFIGDKYVVTEKGTWKSHRVADSTGRLLLKRTWLKRDGWWLSGHYVYKLSNGGKELELNDMSSNKPGGFTLYRQ